MAGGISKRGDQGTLADRSKAGRGTEVPCPMRHVWVADAADRSGVKRAGLLVMWRRTQSGAGWEALVLYGAALRPGEWAVVQEWVAEGLLTQA